ncbi:CDK-activating kinase assembly factor MAT1-domain-containing protein [Globomyces pollinis-pini]|nr:CDK-activating kinase assembly factor MAT1-domain-containing protein [Globomyces pollinis-pini]
MVNQTTDVNQETCPVCLTDKYLNKNLKLLVSPCFHKMCETCVNRLFLSGPAPCPICKTTLRKGNFVVQTFDDLYVEKEVQIRRKVSRYFNKRLEDFKSLREYNDYLEEAEEMIFNLINNVNLQETEARIEKFRLENKELIEANKSKQQSEDKALQNQLAREKLEKQLRKEAYYNRAIDEAQNKRKEQTDFIEKLAAANDKSQINSIITETKSKRAPIMAFKPMDVIEVKVEILEDENDIVEDIQDDADYSPLDTVMNSIVFPVSQNYSCGWSGPLMKDHGDLCRASGYLPKFTYERALVSASQGIFQNILPYK